MAVLALLMVILAVMVGATSSTWQGTRGKVEQFQQAREAFEAVISRLSEATLNTYYEYEDAAGRLKDAANSRTFEPARYARQSDLRFLSGPGITGDADHTTHAVFFQAPAGESATGRSLQNLLNSFGFFVELGDDSRFLPGVLDSSHARERFRLLQFTEPTETLSVYGWTGANPLDRGRGWFQDALNSGAGVSIVAENVIALVLLPMLSRQDQEVDGYTAGSLAPDYSYDSTAANADPALNPRHQLPPVVKVTLIALDETSAARMTNSERGELKGLLDGLFSSVGDTEDAGRPGFARDLKRVEDFLAERGLNFRVFQTHVPIKTAKWSREQES